MEKKHFLQKQFYTMATFVYSLFSMLLIIILRTVFLPQVRDLTTGQYDHATFLVLVILLLVALAGVGAANSVPYRIDIVGKGSGELALASVVAGGMIGLSSLYNCFNLFIRENAYGIKGVFQILLVILGIACAFSLIVWGLQVASENGTRAGMRIWSVLVPTVWSCVRLAQYELNYVSSVHMSEALSAFVMLIAELLFLFSLARFVSGVGKLHPRFLIFSAIATVMMAGGSYISQVVLYMVKDGETYRADTVTGLSDFAVAILAFFFLWALVLNRYNIPVATAEKEPTETDEVSATPMTASSDSDSESAVESAGNEE